MIWKQHYEEVVNFEKSIGITKIDKWKYHNLEEGGDVGGEFNRNNIKNLEKNDKIILKKIKKEKLINSIVSNSVNSLDHQKNLWHLHS